MTNVLKIIIQIFFIIIFNQRVLTCMQEEGTWQQRSSSSKGTTASQRLTKAFVQYSLNEIPYQEFKKETKLAIKDLGVTQLIYQPPTSPAAIRIDPLYYAAARSDYSFMLWLLKKFANPNFSQTNLANVAQTLNQSNTTVLKETVLSHLKMITL